MTKFNETVYMNENFRDEKISLKIIIITLFLSFILFIALTGEGIVIPVFPLYLETFNAGAFELGLLIGIFALTSLILSPIIGAYADKYGRRLFILLGLGGFGIANILYIQAVSFPELLFFRIIEGATASGIGPIVNAMLIDIIPKEHRGRYLGIANGGGFLGIILGPFLGGILVQDGNFARPFEITAFIAFVGMIAALLILPNDMAYFKSKEHKKVAKNYNFKEKMDFRKWLMTGTISLFLTLMFMRFAGLVSWTLIEPSVSFYLYGQNYDSLAVGLYFSCYGITMMFGEIFLGGLSDRIGRKIVLNVGFFFYLLGFIFLINTNQLWRFYLSGALNGIGLSLVIPAVVAILADITENETDRGKVMGFYYGIFYFASIVGPAFGGWLGDLFDLNFVVHISVLTVALAFLASLIIKVPKKERIILQNNFSEPYEIPN
ncbi:MAG: MFS transporter [Candidatus Thorarchaeota archaeon]